MSKIVVINDKDYISRTLVYIFKTVQKTENGVDYHHLKDLLKWSGLPPKDYVGVVIDMYKRYMIEKRG